jgi:hypothetical protein
VGIDGNRLIAIVRVSPGITVPEVAERMGTTAPIIRWAVLNLRGQVEFYEGNRLRLSPVAQEAG